jgi:hypothetical protein
MNRAAVIVVELNELCPSLMKRFIEERKLPHFERLFHESETFITDAEEQAPYLEPWIQWVTVHSGLPYREHQIFNLADGHKLKEKCLWDHLSAEGHTVWVCGSMNVRYDQPIRGLVLPDPWATEISPSDPELLPYFNFVQRNVQEYTNERVPLTVNDYAAFLRFMTRHGLSLDTVKAVVKQLAREGKGQGRWKRAVLLDRLQFDVFHHFYRKLRPSFSTFFLNSTAHFQHLYWRNMEPEAFALKPSAKEQVEYRSAILFGYQEMDRLIGRLYRLLDGRTTLVFCTALSQQPFLKYESDGGKIFYRPRDFGRLLGLAGISHRTDVVPVMSQNFHIRFETEAEAIEGQELLERLQVGGRHVVFVHRHGASLHAGCGIYRALGPDAKIEVRGEERSVRFADYFYRIDGMKSGMHHPDGMLWVRRPERRHRVNRDKLPLTAVAPMVLDLLSSPLASLRDHRHEAAAVGS